MFMQGILFLTNMAQILLFTGLLKLVMILMGGMLFLRVIIILLKTLKK